MLAAPSRWNKRLPMLSPVYFECEASIEPALRKNPEVLAARSCDMWMRPSAGMSELGADDSLHCFVLRCADAEIAELSSKHDTITKATKAYGAMQAQTNGDGARL